MFNNTNYLFNLLFERKTSKISMGLKNKGGIAGLSGFLSLLFCLCSWLFFFFFFGHFIIFCRSLFKFEFFSTSFISTQFENEEPVCLFANFASYHNCKKKNVYTAKLNSSFFFLWVCLFLCLFVLLMWFSF